MKVTTSWSSNFSHLSGETLAPPPVQSYSATLTVS